jgi:hypothetical protein
LNQIGVGGRTAKNARRRVLNNDYAQGGGAGGMGEAAVTGGGRGHEASVGKNCCTSKRFEFYGTELELTEGKQGLEEGGGVMHKGWRARNGSVGHKPGAPCARG